MLLPNLPFSMVCLAWKESLAVPDLEVMHRKRAEVMDPLVGPWPLALAPQRIRERSTELNRMSQSMELGRLIPMVPAAGLHHIHHVSSSCDTTARSTLCKIDNCFVVFWFFPPNDDCLKRPDGPTGMQRCSHGLNLERRDQLRLRPEVLSCFPVLVWPQLLLLGQY